MKDENGNSYEKQNTFKNDAEFKGFVKARLETVIDIQKDHEKRLRRTETVLTKIMAVASAAGAVFGIVFAFIGDWFKQLFNK